MEAVRFFRGPSDRIDLSVTPFTDGCIYFTPDSGNLYIDALVEGQQKRILINPQGIESKFFDTTLTVLGWENGRQNVSIEGLKAKQNGVVGLSQDVSGVELEAAGNAGLYVCGQADGYFTVSFSGEKPTCDIPITVILV